MMTNQRSQDLQNESSISQNFIIDIDQPLIIGEKISSNQEKDLMKD